jgi:hypothetical protein
MNPAMSLKLKYALLSIIACAGIILTLFTHPIPQSPEYHRFADDRNLCGIPNFWNVMSNLPFVIIGIVGIAFLLRRRKETTFDAGGLTFFSGILLTGFGSVWYHLHPDNHTLIWDRLPMTIAFMAFFSVIIRECMHAEAGKKLLWPLLFLGVLSVYYWQMTESRGQGDLRFYFLVQFLPMLLIPLILLLFKSHGLPKRYFWLVLFAYVIAKVFEIKDVEIFHTTGISGHTVKHLMAAVAPLIFLVGLKISKIQTQRSHF